MSVLQDFSLQCCVLHLLQYARCLPSSHARLCPWALSVVGHGFIGYGISMYKPACAYACRATITNPLNCTTSADSHGNKGMGMDMDMQMGDGWIVEDAPSAKCYATNDTFLQTLALCMDAQCTTQSIATLERY
ncbi:hypothetical protein BJX99DRAFT_255280 [Aspergillus californicus]